MTVKLTASGYWRELEDMDLPLPAKDQLKAMVNAYLSKAIPPMATPHILKSLVASGIKFVALSDSACDYYLEIAEFIPDNKKTGRSFTFLRPTYVYGEAVAIGTKTSRFVHLAIIEDSEGTHHQFEAPTEVELTGKLAGWVRTKWEKDWGDQPDDADDVVNEFFQKHAIPPSVAHGWECELWRAEPVEIEDALPLGIKGPGQPPGFTYPMEIFINGELNFKLDSEDAEGDLRAIKALMTWRTAKRENRPLTNMELYGTELGIGDAVHTDAHGNTLTLRGGKAIQGFAAPHGKLRVDSPPTEGQD